jgi:hypothetical protein
VIAVRARTNTRAQWTPYTCLGDLVAEAVAGFRECYPTYYAHFDASNELLGRRLKTNEKLRAMCAAIQVRV